MNGSKLSKEFEELVSLVWAKDEVNDMLAQVVGHEQTIARRPPTLEEAMLMERRRVQEWTLTQCVEGVSKQVDAVLAAKAASSESAGSSSASPKLLNASADADLQAHDAAMCALLERVKALRNLSIMEVHNSGAVLVLARALRSRPQRQGHDPALSLLESQLERFRRITGVRHEVDEDIVEARRARQSA